MASHYTLDKLPAVGVTLTYYTLDKWWKRHRARMLSRYLCTDCDRPAEEMHDELPMCRSCHRELHKREGRYNHGQARGRLPAKRRRV